MSKIPKYNLSPERIERMRIHEILFWNNDPAAEGNLSDPGLDFPPDPFNNDLIKLASAFTKHGRVKHFWNLSGSEDQPAAPGPANAEPAFMPSGMSEPTTASWQAEPAETEPPVRKRRLIPFRQHRGISI